MKGGTDMKVLKVTLLAARKKISRRAGETLTETLVALLISAVAITMLASMIMTSRSLIDSSKKMFDAYYEENNALSEYSGTATSGTATLSDGTNAVRLVNGSDSVSVKVYTNDKAPSNKPVISYEK